MDTAVLRSGLEMPIFGLGTWLSSDGGEAYQSTASAREVGYKLIDTAQMYGNEDEIGRALDEANSTEAMFVVSKLDPKCHGATKCRASLLQSTTALRGSLDVYLIHSPRGGKILETWDELLKCRNEGLVKAVGVSNFGVNQLQGLLDAGRELPEVNQVELHCWNQQKDLLQFCKRHEIVVMGYCPLARRKLFNTNTAIQEIALRHGKSEADVCINWSIRMGVVTIPKSSNVDRITSNYLTALKWSLTSEEVDTISQSCDIGFKASSACNAMDIPWNSISFE